MTIDERYDARTEEAQSRSSAEDRSTSDPSLSHREARISSDPNTVQRDSFPISETSPGEVGQEVLTEGL